MRCPHVRDLEDVDVAVIGIPTDDAVSFRSGARFGPEAIRSASVLLRNYNPILRVNVAERLSIVDWGDAPTVPAMRSTRSSAQARPSRRWHAPGSRRCASAAITPFSWRSCAALAAVHGPLGLIQLDSHHDLWDEYFGQKVFHGSIVRRAVEEGLIDPARSLAGGPARLALRAPMTSSCPRASGSTRSPSRSSRPSGRRVLDEGAERVGAGPCFLSFDIDFVDPAFAPGTGTPRWAARRAGRR